MNRLFLHKIIAAFIFLTFISCSKDSDEPIPQETEITVSTSDFSITIDENPTNGQVIGTVLGNTNDGAVTFSITEQTPSGAFSIDAGSGELKVADVSLFDFETNPTITGIVKVMSGPISENSLITILLNDLAENPIYEGDIQLKTQQEVIAFGAQKTKRITGTLTIGETQSNYSNITDLTPLSGLEKVDGNLYIVFNGELVSTAGLENISSIGGDIAFVENLALERIEGLQNITEIFGGLLLQTNLKLKTFNGFNQIRTVADKIILNDNPEILNLDWLSNLESMGQPISMSYNTKITNIDGLSNLTNMGIGFLSIQENPSLEDLDGLENVTATVTHILIKNNDSLLNINGVRNITPTEHVSIQDNALITNLSSLSNVVSLNYLTIEGNDSLLNLEGLNNLQNINNDLSIGGNLNLKTLTGLSGLTNVTNEMNILGNYRLEDLCELRSFLTSGNLGLYNVYGNFFNPTKQDIIDGNCSL